LFRQLAQLSIVLENCQILNLLEEIKGRFGLTLLFIAHDLAVVKAVMYLGRLCEVGPSEQLFARPPAAGFAPAVPCRSAMQRRGAGTARRGAGAVRGLPSSADLSVLSA
jgi:hypothetical protein